MRKSGRNGKRSGERETGRSGRRLTRPWKGSY